MILASVNIISIGCFLLRTNSNIVMYHVAEVEINNPDPSGENPFTDTKKMEDYLDFFL